MKITEDNFIEQVQIGNEKALEYVLAIYGGVIKTIVKKHLYSLESYQEECINDILMAIWSNIDRYNPNKSSFKNWVAGISKYKALNYLRKYLKDLGHENIDDIEMGEEDNTATRIIQNELDENISVILKCLKEEDRALFIKLYVDQQDMNQISAETGMKREVIYNRVSRGKRKIQQLFGKAKKVDK